MNQNNKNLSLIKNENIYINNYTKKNIKIK